MQSSVVATKEALERRSRTNSLGERLKARPSLDVLVGKGLVAPEEIPEDLAAELPSLRRGSSYDGDDEYF